jgi:hypothetical protein
VQSFTAADGRRVEHIYGYTGERAIRREYDAAGQLAHEVLYFTRNLEVRDGKLVRWVYFAGERIAESPTRSPSGFPSCPPRPLSPPPWGPGPSGSSCCSARRPAPAPMAPRRLLVAAATLGARQLGRRLSCHRQPPHAHPRRAHPLSRRRPPRLRALVLDHRGRVLTRDAADPYGAPALAWRADDDTAAPTTASPARKTTP